MFSCLSWFLIISTCDLGLSRADPCNSFKQARRLVYEAREAVAVFLAAPTSVPLGYALQRLLASWGGPAGTAPGVAACPGIVNSGRLLTLRFRFLTLVSSPELNCGS